MLDRYLVPLGARPVLSPALETVEDAIVDFRKAATQVHGKEVQSGYHSELHETKPIFERWTGSEALVKLQEYATNFAINHLL